MLDIVLRPDQYFKSINEKAGLKIPLLIVLSMVIFSNAPIIYLLNSLVSQTASYNTMAFIVASLLIILVSLLSSVLTWLLISGIFFSITYFLKGSGSYKKTIALVGYGLIPYAVSSFIFLMAMALYLHSGSIIMAGDSADLKNDFDKIIQGNPFSLSIQITSIICTLLSGYIWVFAIKNARNISLGKAIMTVVIPVSLFLLYTLSTFILT